MKYRLISVVSLTLPLLLLSACDQLKESYFSPPPDAKSSEQHDGTHQGEGESAASHEGAEEQHGKAGEHAGGGHHAAHKVVVTSPIVKQVVSTQQYVCQIHSSRHIEIKALEGGYLEKIFVKEGQLVKEGDLMFKILPTLYQARLDSDEAEAELAKIELQNTEQLFQKKIVSQPEVALAKAKLAKAQAKVNLARAELNFADVKAPFDGIVDKQYQQQGSLIEEGAMLTTLSDNSVMWVYFNVPEARYLEYQTRPQDDLKVELVLANHQKFEQDGVIGAIEADFNNENGNIAFRADFPNPDRLLRNGQTGTVRLSRIVEGALVIPQRAKFEILAKTYVFVVDENDVVHQREITVEKEMDDIYLIKDGLSVNDKIVLEGILQVRDGDKAHYEFEPPEEVLGHLKYHAE